jgi:hypothetical protein
VREDYLHDLIVTLSHNTKSNPRKADIFFHFPPLMKIKIFNVAENEKSANGAFLLFISGEGGIRTLGTVSRTHV